MFCHALYCCCCCCCYSEPRVPVICCLTESTTIIYYSVHWTCIRVVLSVEEIRLYSNIGNRKHGYHISRLRTLIWQFNWIQFVRHRSDYVLRVITFESLCKIILLCVIPWFDLCWLISFSKLTSVCYLANGWVFDKCDIRQSVFVMPGTAYSVYFWSGVRVILTFYRG